MNNIKCIICDPPWSFDDRLQKMKRPVKRSAISQYKVMSVAEIAALDVKSLADPMGCLLALWVPSSMLDQGLEVMNAWGFKLKQTFVWVKLKKDYALEENWNLGTRVGMGRLFRQSHEIALIGTSGKSVYPWLEDHSQRSVAFDLNQGHSIKPPTLHERLEKMFPDVEKLELFSRRKRVGWTCIGDAIDGKDITVAIQELITE
jgi:N6-adenosine-specific RNA methylase IME4